MVTEIGRSPGLACCEEQLDGVGDVDFGDVMIAALDAQAMGVDEHVGGAEAFGGFELVTGQLDLQSVGIVKVDRIHESAIPLNEFDTALAQAGGSEREGGARNVECQMLDAAGLARGFSAGVRRGLVGKHGEETSIAGVEVQVILIGLAEVRLLEEERHAERALPEVQRALLRRPHESDVVHSLHLGFRHGYIMRPGAEEGQSRV